MNEIFYGLIDFNLSPNIESIAILLFRTIAGFSMSLHGLAKIKNASSWMGNKIPSILQFLATLAQFLGGIFLILGLFTRLTSVVIIFTMLVAIILGHLLVSDPIYRITTKLSNEGDGTVFYGLPMWFAKADGTSKSGSGSAELAILYLTIGIALLIVGGGKYSIDSWLI